MSPRPGAPRQAAGDHRRARSLAAGALDEPLSASDAAWLTGHLARCAACRAIAAEYDEQRVLLRSLRDTAPSPPRDLWARTAAAIERQGAAGRRASLGVAWPRRAPWAPLAGLLVVAIAVGAGLLNGVNLSPVHEGMTTGDGVPVPTPIAMTAGEVQFVTRGPDGSLELSTQRYKEVCPVGADVCGTSAATDTTPLSARLGDLGAFDAVISPTQDHIVVMDKGSADGGVYVVAVNPSATTPPDVSPTPVVASSAPATPTPTSAASATPTGPGPSATPAGTGIPTPTVPRPTPPVPTPAATATPAASPSSPAPTAGLSASPSVVPSPSDGGSAVPELTPSPEVSVTPAPDGTLEIASGVIVVGGVSGYSADGTRFAFSARPADGSAGPDVYVWQTTDTMARPVTADHASLFASWLGDQLLISRVVDGVASATLLDLSTGLEQAVPADGTWRPAVAPDGVSGVWWEGTLTPAADGYSWTPADGRLVLGAWPDGRDVQTLTTDTVADWQVKWDETGSVLALWVTDGAGGQAGSGALPGRLSLYAVNPHSARVNLAKPLLSDAPAFEGFSLRSGRLVWSAPVSGVGGTDSEDTTVEVLAWSGDTIGHLALPTGRGVAVVR